MEAWLKLVWLGIAGFSLTAYRILPGFWSLIPVPIIVYGFYYFFRTEEVKETEEK